MNEPRSGQALMNWDYESITEEPALSLSKGNAAGYAEGYGWLVAGVFRHKTPDTPLQPPEEVAVGSSSQSQILLLPLSFGGDYQSPAPLPIMAVGSCLG
jgi:hypothetical protein